MPSFQQIQDILFDEDLCVQFLLRERVFYTASICGRCGDDMKLSCARGTWRCTRYRCGGELSMKRGTFFAKSNLQCNKIMLLAYLWLNKVPTRSMILMSGMSSKTVCAFTGHFRQLVADSLDEEQCTIGGPGIVVEIDESKLGKRKYNTGHRVDGVWVFGGIERTPEKKVFMAKVANRNQETLLEAINRFIRPGSIIFSDMWRGYINLEAILGMEHRVVNHSREFVAEDGTHTNSIEGSWCGLKILIPKRNRTKNIDDYLWEYVWRKQHAQDLWASFIQALVDVLYE